MYFNKVEICGIDTSTLKVLTEKEKCALIDKAKGGDKYARETLVMGNLRLVLSVIQRFANRGENLDDLFQVGCIGLMKAIDNFDTSHDVRFSTYAVPMIIGEVRRYLRDNNPVRVSRSMRDTAYHAMQARERLSNTLDREPTVEEIAKELGKPKSEIVIALEAIVEPVSFYEPVYSNGGDTIYLMDQLGDNESDGDWIDEISIKEALKKLPPREKKILSMRFMRGMTQTEVAEEIGISQAQVSRLEKSAINTIKDK
ncbi:MAG: RNA polymerase sporulation sigma factor SigG [Clostridia bacterium]|nr:RNA polymerase sporulation sigma factor SigG [Clostridia bacterium]